MSAPLLAESIITIASFREAIKKRRCLELADVFYIRNKINTKRADALEL